MRIVSTLLTLRALDSNVDATASTRIGVIVETIHGHFATVTNFVIIGLFVLCDYAPVHVSTASLAEELLFVYICHSQPLPLVVFKVHVIVKGTLSVCAVQGVFEEKKAIVGVTQRC